MEIPVDHEFLTLCDEILKQNLSLQKWREIESDDMFQSRRYEGGFDATEDAFCFSYYQPDGDELWFQLELSQIAEVVAGKKTSIEARKAWSRT